MVIQTSVLYRFHLVFGPPWWWPRRVEVCGRKQYVIIRIHANLLQVYFAHFRQQCPRRQELRARINLPQDLLLLASFQLCLCSILDHDSDCSYRFYRAAVFRPIKFFNTILQQGGTRWRSWLRHCASSWKFACSIPDSITGIIHSSCRTVPLGYTQLVTEMSIRDIS
jgi:hypothetical protein